jgi:hypothetical protein
MNRRKVAHAGGRGVSADVGKSGGIGCYLGDRAVKSNGARATAIFRHPGEGRDDDDRRKDERRKDEQRKTDAR